MVIETIIYLKGYGLYRVPFYFVGIKNYETVGLN